VKRKTWNRLLTGVAAVSLAIGTMAPVAFAATTLSTLPASGGLLIGNTFYSFTYIADNTSAVQTALNSAGISNVTLDIGGSIANFASFIATGNVSNTAFSAYARAHPATIPSGVTIDDVQNGVTVSSTYSSLPSTSTSTTGSLTSGTTSNCTTSTGTNSSTTSSGTSLGTSSTSTSTTGSSTISTTGTWTQVESIPQSFDGNNIDANIFTNNDGSIGTVYGTSQSVSTGSSSMTGYILVYNNGTWTQTNSIPDTNSVGFTEDNNGNMYVFSVNGNNQTLWAYNKGVLTQINGFPSGSQPDVSQDENGNFYVTAAASDGSTTIWESTNGINGPWTQIITGAPSGLILFPWLNNNGIMYGSSDNYNSATSTNTTTFWSYNNGKWTSIGNFSGYAYPESLNGTLYALVNTFSNGSNTATAYYDNNGSWTPVSGLPASVNNLQYFNGTLLAATNNGVYEDKNGSWVELKGDGSQSPNNVADLWQSTSGVIYAESANYQNTQSTTPITIWSYQ
jgi:hypothetical protein